MSDSLPAWNDIAVIRENVESPRAHFTPFETQASARSNNLSANQYHQSLNGSWNFNYSDSPDERPVDFFRPEFNVSEWPTIPVPSNWERHGHGYAIYVNVPYPFEINEPLVPSTDNPVGSYRRDFEIPANWTNRDIFVNFGAVSSAFFVWINGHYVGYSEGSKTPSEFEVGGVVRPGTNTIAVEVYRWSNGSYLEDQDFWSLSGIQRDVSLYARPMQRVRDFEVSASLTNQFRDGDLNVDIELVNTDQSAVNVEVSIQLSDGSAEEFSQTRTVALQPGANSTRFSALVGDVKSWSAERPDLYEMMIILEDRKREVSEVISTQIGFRTVQIDNGRFLINGQRVKLKGTNLHEHHHEHGHAIDEATMVEDIRLMKAANLNAVRTSHYPFPERFYQLTDKYGLYVVDEANIESHGYGYDHDKTLGNKPHWMPHHLDRTQRMVERDKNFPSVVIWSLGNEAGDGVNLGATYKWIKSRDLSRPVQYETEGNLEKVGERHSDFHSSMYWRHWDLEEYAQTHNDRPFVLIEYAHSMGNSTGNLKEYWNVINRHDVLAGGFIWDWVDQGLLEHNENGTPYWTYGGDYGPIDVPSSGNFNFNGIVFPDRSVQPAYWEVKRVYQHVDFADQDLRRGLIRVANNYNFLSLKGFELAWVRHVDGRQIDFGVVSNLDIAPGDSKSVALEFKSADLPAGEQFVDLQLRLPKPMGLLPSGHVYAEAQLEMPDSRRTPPAEPAKEGGIAVLDSDSAIAISHQWGTVKVDKQSGLIISMSNREVELLLTPLTPDLWRAPTDNDFGNYMGEWAAVWQQASRHQELKQLEITNQQPHRADLTAVFEFRNEAGGKIATWTSIYTIWSSGEVDVSNTFEREDGLPVIPRVGMNVELIPTISQVEWYGRGPFENYSDRQQAADVGLYKNTVADHYVPYMRPQENGYKTDVRRLSLTDTRGFGIALEAHDLFSFGVLHNRQSDFIPPAKIAITDEDGPGAAENKHRVNVHVSDITPRPLISLNVDYGQMGVGGDDSWGKRTLNAYTLNERIYQYGFRIKLLWPED